jgi:hypothetical protein
MAKMQINITRRGFIKTCSAATMVAATAPALAGLAKEGLSPALLQQAMVAFVKHRDRLIYRDTIGIVDFSRRSSTPRLFIVDIATRIAQSHLVAHGRGSDPAHTGWARQFSNQPGSFASSVGAYLTGAEYSGQHGRSMRLAGLDAENDNAESRAIVVHAAWYVTPEIAVRTGMLGRSQGCFALSDASLGPVLDQLGKGRLLYAART